MSTLIEIQSAIQGIEGWAKMIDMDIASQLNDMGITSVKGEKMTYQKVGRARIGMTPKIKGDPSVTGERIRQIEGWEKMMVLELVDAMSEKYPDTEYTVGKIRNALSECRLRFKKNKISDVVEKIKEIPDYDKMSSDQLAEKVKERGILSVTKREITPTNIDIMLRAAGVQRLDPIMYDILKIKDFFNWSLEDIVYVLETNGVRTKSRRFPTVSIIHSTLRTNGYLMPKFKDVANRLYTSVPDWEKKSIAELAKEFGVQEYTMERFFLYPFTLRENVPQEDIEWRSRIMDHMDMYRAFLLEVQYVNSSDGFLTHMLLEHFGADQYDSKEILAANCMVRAVYRIPGNSCAPTDINPLYVRPIRNATLE